MGKTAAAVAGFIVLSISLRAAEIHVATSGKDSNPGTRSAPRIKRKVR